MKKVTLIKGDGIGPEISDAVLKIIASAGVELDSDEDDSCCCELEELDSSSPPQATTNGRSISNARISAKIFFKFLYLLNKFSNLHISP
jgi:isocitrate/isopropylmalate dehydrogenase